MKLEDLTQEQLDELLSSRDALNDSVKGLKSDIAKLKAKAKGADIDPEAHAALQTEVEELRGSLTKAETAAKKEIDKLAGQLKEKDGSLQKYLIDASLSDTLVKAGVKPEFMDASKALLKLGATLRADNGEYAAFIGDKPLGDYVGEWVKSDQGKHFIAAPANNGGGAGGGDGAGSKAAGKLDGSPEERAAYFKEKYKFE